MKYNSNYKYGAIPIAILIIFFINKVNSNFWKAKQKIKQPNEQCMK